MKVARRKLLLTFGVPLVLVGCAAMGPPRPPSLQLPKPPADLRAVRKGGRVTLTWSVPALTTDHATVRSLGATRICRSEAVLKECGTPVGEAAAQPRGESTSAPRPGGASNGSKNAAPARVPLRANKGGGQKITESYTDVLFSGSMRPETLGFANYAVEVLNANGRGAGLSNEVRVPLARTLPPPPDFGAQVTGQGVRLTWSSAAATASDLEGSHSQERAGESPAPPHYVYRVYRRVEGGGATLVGEVPLTGEMKLLFTDSSIEWEQTYHYHVEAVTIIAGTLLPAEKSGDYKKDEASVPKKIEIEGDDSAEVKVFAHDVFPPAVPAELQAVFSGPGQEAAIDLVWAPVTDVDLAGYNVYRREAGGTAAKINSELVKTPAYRDGGVAAGKAYLYSVSAVDERGNESARSEEAGERVP